MDAEFMKFNFKENIFCSNLLNYSCAVRLLNTKYIIEKFDQPKYIINMCSIKIEKY